jgi:hypothetical protein
MTAGRGAPAGGLRHVFYLLNASRRGSDRVRGARRI